MTKRLLSLFLAVITVFALAGPAYAESTATAVGQEAVTYEASKLSAPKISKVENTETGVKIRWGKVSGAAKYRVYYKKSGTGWKKITDTKKTSYTWTKAKSGTKYSFSVRTVNSKGKLSSYSDSRSITFIAAPELKSAKNTSSGVKITWSKVSGAAKYQVYCKTGSDSKWKALGSPTGKTSYTWKKAADGVKYTFTVQSISSSGKTVSGYGGSTKSVTTPSGLPGYPGNTAVFVSNSGHKIHLHSDCSGMKYYTAMTLSEALAKGYETCDKCFAKLY